MSFVSTVPDVVAAAATDLASIRSNIIAATTAAPITEVIAPAVDEVSTAITALFNAHGLSYQALIAQTAEFHGRFAQNLAAGAASYANTEADKVLHSLPNLGIGNIGSGNVGGGNYGSSGSNVGLMNGGDGGTNIGFLNSGTGGFNTGFGNYGDGYNSGFGNNNNSGTSTGNSGGFNIGTALSGFFSS